MKTKTEAPQAEVDETKKIVVDWFEDAKLPEGFAKRLAEIMSKSEHSPFETAPIKVDTGSEIVRDWFKDEPEKLVQYYKAQAEQILQKLASGSDIYNNQQTPTLVSIDNFSGMHESQAHSANIWAGYGNGWMDSAGGLAQSSAKSPFSEDTKLNYGDTGNSQALYQLQKVLYENGFYGDDIPTTGNFDDTTLKAVIRFQLASNMSWDDLFDSSGKYKGVDSNTLINLEHLYRTSTNENKYMRKNQIGGMIAGGGLYGDPLEYLVINNNSIYKIKNDRKNESISTNLQKYYNNHEKNISEINDLNSTGKFDRDIDIFTSIYKDNKHIYDKISNLTGIPSELIAAIHYRESNCNFNTYLHNGQKLGTPTTIKPEGRNFDDFFEAAIDALMSIQDSLGIYLTPSSDIIMMMTFAEVYNGTGYTLYRDINSPYLYSGTNLYQKGKYVGDGTYNSNAIDDQPGIYLLINAIT